jgi:hypothetical protein
MTEHVEYNVTTNRLYYWPSARLSEDEYAKIKRHGFFWWPRGCFTAIWNPGAEDYLLDLGLEIEENDEPDDLDARIERYETHADNAAGRAEQADAGVRQITDGIGNLGKLPTRK